MPSVPARVEIRATHELVGQTRAYGQALGEHLQVRQRVVVSHGRIRRWERRVDGRVERCVRRRVFCLPQRHGEDGARRQQPACKVHRRLELEQLLQAHCEEQLATGLGTRDLGVDRAEDVVQAVEAHRVACAELLRRGDELSQQLDHSVLERNIRGLDVRHGAVKQRASVHCTGAQLREQVR